MLKITYYTNFNGVDIQSHDVSHAIVELIEDEIVHGLQREFDHGIVDNSHINYVISNVIKRHLNPTIETKIYIDEHSC